MPPRKPRCNFKECKEAAQRIVGDCSFCAGHFCSKHRMLEAHSCTGLEDCKKESHARNADKLNSERTVVVKGQTVCCNVLLNRTGEMGLSPRLHLPISISNSVSTTVSSPTLLTCLLLPFAYFSRGDLGFSAVFRSTL
ncbi:hypothetical protein PENANT_c023G02650 [Penicillium antarcticum]|uniref:AN1-type domain-containing protein n=1 Tax=Penicillium antarcticum TaxID=416450 RepID=A0A1V6PZ06_9EURO|nr:hypothetical protein PENANT_c023G02650 [Penicillium antarcticum]